MHVQLLQAKKSPFSFKHDLNTPSSPPADFPPFIVCNLETCQCTYFQQHPSSQTKFPHFFLPQDHLITYESNSSTCNKTHATLETKHHQEECYFEYLEGILEAFCHKLATTPPNTCSIVDPYLRNQI
ncbi:hypothetical protein ACFX1R_010981 [Malus domestica]